MVDSTDIERLNTASEELTAMLNEDELRDAGLLVFANKQDQPGAKGAGEISEALQLGELRDRNWSIVACSAIDGSGIAEGMDWLVVSTPLRLIIEQQWLANPSISKRSTQSNDKSCVASICQTKDSIEPVSIVILSAGRSQGSNRSKHPEQDEWGNINNRQMIVK